MKVSYDLKTNGWDSRMYIHVDLKTFGTGNVRFDLSGITEGTAKLDLKTGILTPDKPVVVKPYDDNKKPKTFDKFKVAPFTLMQIKTYIS